MLSRDASLLALDRAGVGVEELDTIVLATASPDRLLPSTACDLQALLGATNAAAFDVVAACPGYVYALTVAEGLIASGQSKTVLVVGAEKLSTITDFQDRSTAILFGDGAGASVVRRAGGLGTRYPLDLPQVGRAARPAAVPAGRRLGRPDQREGGLRAVALHEDGRPGGLQGRRPRDVEACDAALSRAGVSADEIDLLIPAPGQSPDHRGHRQARRMPMSKVMVNLDRFGNTSSASIPLALDQAVAEGRVGPGSLLLLVAFGAGFTWGSAVVRW
jgi:3-oxoacyl-[acyl-carrier-protein] synthase-3